MTLNLRNSVRTSLNPGLRQSITGGVDSLGLFRSSSLDLRFAKKRTLTDRVSGNNLITFSRASSGTYVDSDGLIKTAVADAPRFDHDPVTGESLGLLIEESRTNLLEYSEQLDQWSKGSATVVTSNTIAAPDGALTADKVYLPSSGTRYIAESVTLTQDKTYTFSVYAKAVTPGTNNVFLPRIGSPSPKSPSSEFVATSEWQRFVFTFTHTDATASTPIFPLNINAPYIVDLYLWGAQLEAGSFPTSIIPTTGSAVTRAADIASIEGTNFSSWYNQSEGTVFAIAEAPAFANTVVASLASDSNNDRMEVRSSGSSLGKARSTIKTNAATVFDSPISAGAGSYRSLALGYKLNDTRYAVDGSLGTLDTSVTLPSVNRLYLGNEFNNTYVRPGHISRLAYFPTRKTDQELVNMTS